MKHWFTDHRYSALMALVAAHLALGGLYLWATPIFEAPDEGYHVAVIRHIAQGYGLPVQQPGLSTDWAQEGSQPPLYYALAAGLTFWVNTDDWADVYVRNPFLKHIPGAPHNVNFFRHLRAPQWSGTLLFVLIIRLFSLALGALNVWLTYELAWALFPGQATLATLTTTLVALNPKALFINASVNNDNLLMFLSTAALVVMVQLMRPEARRLWHWANLLGTRQNEKCVWRRAALLGVILGAAALTKVSGLVLWPIAVLVLWVAWPVSWQSRAYWRTWLGLLALTFGLALLMSGWWFARNWQLYGEWLGLDTMVAIAHPRAADLTVGELIQTEWRGFFLSYWSVFGVFTILPADWVHWFFDALTLAALVGGFMRLMRARLEWRLDIVALGGFCVLTLFGVVRWTMQTPASQGRLLFGAIAPLSLFIAWGLLGLFARPRGLATGLIALLAGVALIIPVLYIAPRYQPPAAMTDAQMPPHLRPLHVVFDKRLELLGYTIRPEPRHPGETQAITFYWRALQPISQDYVLALHMLGRNYAKVGTLDTWPGGGLAPTSQWLPEQIFADTYQLPIASSAATPSVLRVTLSFWGDNPRDLLVAEDGDGNILTSITFPVGRMIPLAAPAFAPSLVEGTSFEYGLRLLGLDARAQNEQLALNFYWQTTEPIPADYTLFLYVINERGESLLQADAPPLGDDWPTSAWEPNVPFVDDRRLIFPAALPPGRYGLRFGWYDPSSGERLTAWRADGAPWPENIVIVPDAFEVR